MINIEITFQQPVYYTFLSFFLLLLILKLTLENFHRHMQSQLTIPNLILRAARNVVAL